MASHALGKPPHFLHIAPGLVDGVGTVVQPINPTAAAFLRFFRAVMTEDMVAPRTGHIHLADFSCATGERACGGRGAIGGYGTRRCGRDSPQVAG